MAETRADLVKKAATALAEAQAALRRSREARELAVAAGATSEELHDAREELRPPEHRLYWRDIPDE